MSEPRSQAWSGPATGASCRFPHEKFPILCHPNHRPIGVAAGILSAMEPGDNWTGETGFVHEALARRFDNQFSGHKAYICGPPLMVEACIRTLMQGRLFERDIYTERFLTASDAEGGKLRSPVFKRI